MREKSVSIISICLFIVLIGSSVFFYVKTKDYESRLADLERTNEMLTEELNNPSKKLTNNLEIIGSPTWITYHDFYCSEVRFTVKNNGTSILAVTGILLNSTFIEVNPPILLSPNDEKTINITNPAGFISGAKYEFEVLSLIVDSSGKYIHEAMFPAPELEVTDIDFEGTNGNRYINVTVKNICTSTTTITEIWVNNEKKLTTVQSISPNETKTIPVPCEWMNGDAYEAKVITSEGNEYYRIETAPSA